MQCPYPINLGQRKGAAIRVSKSFRGSRSVIVPCGKCLVCLMNKRRDWVFRLQQEHRHSVGSLFVTLTYHPKFCPDVLQKEHVQLFMKRLRKHEKGKFIRYFAVGEYGSNFGRPHYHLLLFNVDLSGDTVRKAWRAKDGSDIGLIHIGRVTQASIAYCTKYVVQPRSDKKTFTLMSRKYGIGGKYLSDEMVAWHRSHDKGYALLPDGVKARLPRFYKDKIWYNEERERVGNKWKWQGIREHRENVRLFKRKFGDDYQLKMKEMRNAFLEKVHVKVAFSQTL